MTELDDEVIRFDAYLDDLLARRARLVRSGGSPRLPADLVHAAEVVREALVRFHPSFRFEEQLAARLRAAAESMRRGRPEAAVVTEPPSTTDGAPEPLADHPAERGRGFLLGGAIASGVSLAGAALLAWRFARAEDRWERLA